MPMKLRKINLEICMKCQAEHVMAENCFCETSLAKPLCHIGDLRYESSDACVFWARRRSVCATIIQRGVSTGRQFNDFVERRLVETRPYRFIPSKMSYERWMACLRQSVCVLKEAMEKFPCEVIIEEQRCPYVLEHVISNE